MKSTLIIGLYFKDMHTACMASLRAAAGLQTGVLTWHGHGLASALHKILQEAKPINASHLKVLCNHPGLVDAFTPPVRLALPDVRKVGRKQIPCGNENQWDVARDLCHYERWQIVLSEAPKAKGLWYEKFGESQTVGTGSKESVSAAPLHR